MNEPREEDRDAHAHRARGSEEAETGQANGGKDSLTQSLETALEIGYVDPKDVVRLLACRLSATERRLERVDRWMDRIRRRTTELESHLAGLSGRMSEHEETLRMMCLVLKELDDPYGFGISLDERISYDEPDRTEEERG